MTASRSRDLLGALAAALLATSSLAACSSSPSTGGTGASPSASPPASPSPGPSPRSLSIVALGDSVPRGTNCDCTPYPDLSAQQLEAEPARTVTASNDSVAGYTTDDVLRQLTSDQDVVTRVGRADAVEIEVGANDVAYSGSCGTTLSCYSSHVPQMETNLRAIVTRVHELTAGRQVLVVLLDYWSVWLGGAYAAAQGQAYVTTAEQLTHEVNTAIIAVVKEKNATYVDLREAFKGPDYAYDETHYLSDDGDHPNAAGHEQIAKATVEVITAAVHA